LPTADSMPAGGGQTALAELRTTKKALGRYFVVGLRRTPKSRVEKSVI
jgi:hypothetical protein